MQNTNSPVITQKQELDARILSSKLPDAVSRKCAYVDFTGALFAIDYLVKRGLRASTNRSIFKCTKLYHDFEIADIYCNSHSLYVLTAYGSDTVKVPISHKKFNVLPEAYIVLELKIGMREASIKGVIYPEDLEIAEIDGKYYKFNLINLRSIDPLLEKLRKYTGIKSSVGRHLDCMNMFIPYIDNRLNEDEKKTLIGHILTCETCKKRLMQAIEFDINAKKIESHGNILPKEVIGSKNAFLRNLHIQAGENAKELQGAIDVIYKNDGLSGLKEDSFKYKTDVPKNLQKLCLTAFVVIAVLFAVTIFAFNMPKNNKMKSVQGVALSDEVQNYTENAGSNFEVNIPVIGKNKAYASISKVSWEVSNEVTKDDQKKFLQSAGKSIRLNLQNDLLLSNDAAINNQVKFDITFMRDGSLDEISINQSSGSNAVDEIVKQSIENTLYYMHPPKGSFAGRKNGLTLVIEF